MTREEVKDLLKFIVRKCDLIINNENYTADDYVQDNVEDIAEMCHRVLDGQFGEIVPNLDIADARFAIVTNTKTGKWFCAEKCFTDFSTPKKINDIITDFSGDITIIPKNINDIIPVIGTPRLPDCSSKKEELVGDNEKLHIEVFNADKVMELEIFLYNVWISGINYGTNEIVLTYDCMVKKI